MRETARVLRPNGTLVTQQVACCNTLNILGAFGWTTASFGPGWWQPVEELAAEFEQIPFSRSPTWEATTSAQFREGVRQPRLQKRSSFVPLET